MKDDMARTNGDSHDIHDAATRIGILSQRTTNLETLVQSINQSIGAMSTKVEERFNALSATMAERNKTQWPVIWSAIGVSFAVLAYFVTQALEPIKSNQVRFEQTIMSLAAETNRSIEALGAKSVTRDELDWRSQRGAEDRKRTEEAIAVLRAGSVDRDEWLQQVHGRDQQVTELSRRIDEIRENLGNQYTTRDLLLQLQQELNELRRRVSEAGSSRLPPG